MLSAVDAFAIVPTRAMRRRVARSSRPEDRPRAIRAVRHTPRGRGRHFRRQRAQPVLASRLVKYSPPARVPELQLAPALTYAPRLLAQTSSLRTEAAAVLTIASIVPPPRGARSPWRRRNAPPAPSPYERFAANGIARSPAWRATSLSPRQSSAAEASLGESARPAARPPAAAPTRMGKRRGVLAKSERHTWAPRSRRREPSDGAAVRVAAQPAIGARWRGSP